MDAVELRRIGLDQIAGMKHGSLRGNGFEGFLIVSPLVKEAAQRELLPFERLHQPYRDNPVIMRIRQAAEENPVHHAEDRRGCADAQRQCGNHREGESRIAPEAAQRIAHVLRHRAQPPTGPLLIALLPRPLHAAKFDQRMPARLRRRHPRGYLRRNRLLHMKPEFFVQLALRPPQNQKLQPRPEFPHHACTSGSKPICAVRLWLTRTTRAAAPPSVARPPLFAPESAWPSEPPRPAAVRSLHTRTDRACSRCRAGS